jgi:hypothetical protein
MHHIHLSLHITTKFSHSLKTGVLIVLIALITSLGFSLRLYAAHRLPISSDERVYFKSALQYADILRQRDWKMLTWLDYNYQHPPFYKIVYGAALLTRPPMGPFWDKDFTDGMAMARVDASPWGLTDRYISVIFGGLTVLALAAVNPIAGLLYAIDTRAIQYNSYIYLEALPTLTSFLSLACYLYWYERIYRKSRPAYIEFAWLGLSAGLLGIALASKYTYAVVGLAIPIHFLGGVLLRKNRFIDVWKLAAFGIFALLVFYVCDPFIWKHPISHLLESLTFHLNYTKSSIVQDANLPFYQPLIELSAPVTTFSGFINNSSSFLFKLDTIIALLALAGLPRLFSRQPLYAIWLVIGLGSLLFWTTKWPQYLMIVIVPVCISAAMGAGWLFELVKNRVVSSRSGLSAQRN